MNCWRRYLYIDVFLLNHFFLCVLLCIPFIILSCVLTTVPSPVVNKVKSILGVTFGEDDVSSFVESILENCSHLKKKEEGEGKKKGEDRLREKTIESNRAF